MNADTRRPPATISRIAGWLWAVGAVTLLLSAVAIITVRASQPPTTGPMGGVVYTPESEASGVAALEGLVVHGADIDLGEIPLNVTVIPEWTITNTGDQMVRLGEPHASVREGCCPGPLELTGTSLAPGESARLAFPLQMHPGMGGPHHFEIHLPIADGDEYLTLKVTGHFG